MPLAGTPGPPSPSQALPGVSVCIPTYNSVRFLAEAIESGLAQEGPLLEVVVCDNASTDETPALCERYCGPRFRYLRSEELVGQAGNWNRCLRSARGEYVALLHADDRYLRGFVAARAQALDRCPEAGLAFGGVRLIDQAGAPLGERVLQPDAGLLPVPQLLRALLFGCVVNPVTPVVRRAAYAAVGEFNDALTWGIDWDMWLRLALRSPAHYDPEPLAEYRIHASSGTSSVLALARTAADDRSVVNAAFRAIEQHPELHSLLALRRPAWRALAYKCLGFAGECCERGDRQAARQQLREAVRTDPFVVTRPTTWALALESWIGGMPYRRLRALRESVVSARSPGERR